MKKSILILAVLFVVSCLLGGCAARKKSGLLIEDGMAQPILKYTNAQSEDYTNEGSDILRFVVYVETDNDTDADGMPDLIKTMVQIPRAAAEGEYQVPVIYEARPYIAGMYGYTPALPEIGASDFDESSLESSPEKRKVAGEMSTLDLAGKADPKDWYYHLESDPFDQQYLQNLTAYDYYLVRGFGIVQTAGPGTWGSEGIECCTSEQERDAFKCVIEWLTGDRNAFTDRSQNISVQADWCSGKIGMTGRSYAGALAFELASTGVKGLETVVPVAGPSSWYDYANSQGLPSGLLNTYDFIYDLAVMCASRCFQDTDPELLRYYENYLAHIRDEQIALEGDYGPFWAERDYSNRTGFKTSALIVQGMNDVMVHPKQFDLMRSAFLNSGCEVNCILHQNGHVTPANEQTGTDIMIGDHTYTEWLNLWFTHYLLDVDNEISSMPDMMVQSNVDGAFYGTDQWNTGNNLRFEPEEQGEFTVSASNAHMYNPTLLEEVFDGRSGSDRLVWSMDISEDTTVNGPVELHIRAKTEDTDKKALMMGAVLVDSAEKPFSCFDTRSVGVLEQKVIEEDGVEIAEGAKPYDLVEWEQIEKNRAIVSYGTLDLRNPESGYVPSSAAASPQPIESGKWYDYTLYLQPNYYTVAAGHSLELYIVPFCGFSSDDAAYDTYSEEELKEMGFVPEALAPFTKDYSFTVDNSESYGLLPTVR